MKQKEIVSHTGLRGFAAFCVVIHHYRINLEPAFDLSDYTQFFAMSGAFVDLFFILSGFIIAANYQQRFSERLSASAVFAFLRQRLARVYPLHLATMGAMLALFAVRSEGLDRVFDLRTEVVENILLIHAWGINDQYFLNFPSWSISAEWMLYLLFPIFALGFGSTKWRFLLLAVSGIGYVTLFVWGDGLHLNERLSLWRAIPAFILGIALFQYRQILTPARASLLWGLQLGSLLCIFWVLHSAQLEFVLVPGFALLVVLTWQDKGPVSRLFSYNWLRFLGLISYSIYMLHVPVRQAGYLLYGKFIEARIPDPYDPWVFVALCLAGTLIAGTISFYAFEKPCRGWIAGTSKSAKTRIQS